MSIVTARSGLVVAVVATVAACHFPDPAHPSPTPEVVSNDRPATPPRLADDGTPLGLEHFKVWSPTLAQGAQPEGEVAFANLAALGFRTVISVDGAAPDVEAAERHGLRYVHVPIGYDGIPDRAALEIVKAVETAGGPVYVHCHHGKHRGPAAAAIARIAEGDADNATAVADLESSGCSPSYAGLYRDVGAFVKPSKQELDAIRPADLPSVVRPTGLRDAMVHVDHRWDFLKAARASGWGVPSQYPDIDPAHEAGMVENALRDLLREEEGGRRRPAFLRFLEDARAAASDLEQALRDGGPDPASAFDRLKQACDACHAEYRN